MPEITRKIPLAPVLIITVCLLLVISVISLGYFLKDSLLHRISQLPTPLASQVVQADNFVPINQLQNVIKPCLFLFQNSCNLPVNHLSAIIVNPTTDQNTGPEAQAAAELFALINSSSNHGLASYQVPLDATQTRLLFPEQLSSSIAVTLPAPVVIARVADKYNVNYRLLTLLMELVQGGTGPLNSSTTDFTTPYFEKNPGFVEQVVKVAQDLHATQVLYTLQLQEQKHLPSSMTFWQKQYGMDVSVTPESLALMDFLAKNMASKKDFEQAIYQPTAQEMTKGSSIVDVNQNFVLLYQKLFESDPRK